MACALCGCSRSRSAWRSPAAWRPEARRLRRPRRPRPRRRRPAPPRPRSPRPRARPRRPGHTFESLVKPFVMENCASCHGARRQKGDLNLQAYDSLEALTNDADRWELVIRKLRDGDMPPEEEEPRPTAKQVAELTGFVEREIAKADAARPLDPGRVTMRRLNRTEYNNTIRDLLGVDLRPADDFPHDDSGYGFDNIGDVLSTSPLLLEKQLAAAERIARTAIFGTRRHQAVAGEAADAERARPGEQGHPGGLRRERPDDGQRRARHLSRARRRRVRRPPDHAAAAGRRARCRCASRCGSTARASASRSWIRASAPGSSRASRS